MGLMVTRMVGWTGNDSNCLVVTGTMEFYDFPETVGNFIIPTDERIYVSEGVGSTTNQQILALPKNWVPPNINFTTKSDKIEPYLPKLHADLLVSAENHGVSCCKLVVNKKEPFAY